MRPSGYVRKPCTDSCHFERPQIERPERKISEEPPPDKERANDQGRTRAVSRVKRVIWRERTTRTGLLRYRDDRYNIPRKKREERRRAIHAAQDTMFWRQTRSADSRSSNHGMMVHAKEITSRLNAEQQACCFHRGCGKISSVYTY